MLVDTTIGDWHIYALGDTAVTVEFGNGISKENNNKVLQLFDSLQTKPLHGMIEAIPAYSSFTVLYNSYTLQEKSTKTLTVQGWMIQQLEERINQLSFNQITSENKPPIIDIPVCYDSKYAPDIDLICLEKNFTQDDLIRLHTNTIYHVFMTGFLPGFPYMGETVKKLHVTRKQNPVAVKKGSVGLAGNQTGIYPTDSPGGWQIIGRTPITLFDSSKQPPVLLKPGDSIQFYSITSYEFENY